MGNIVVMLLYIETDNLSNTKLEMKEVKMYPVNPF